MDFTTGVSSLRYFQFAPKTGLISYSKPAIQFRPNGIEVAIDLDNGRDGWKCFKKGGQSIWQPLGAPSRGPHPNPRQRRDYKPAISLGFFSPYCPSGVSIAFGLRETEVQIGTFFSVIEQLCKQRPPAEGTVPVYRWHDSEAKTSEGDETFSYFVPVFELVRNAPRREYPEFDARLQTIDAMDATAPAAANGPDPNPDRFGEPLDDEIPF
jgi:hypothetical protein